MGNLIVGVIILALVAGAIIYIYNSKKHGAHCIGCPHAKKCGKCSCGENESAK